MWQMICFTSVAYAQEATRATPKQLVFSATPGAKGILYKVDDTTVSDPLRGGLERQSRSTGTSCRLSV
jgi:hypothetical protein